MRVKIYQIDLQRDKQRTAFMSLSETYQANSQASIDAGIYDEVFNADVEPMSLEEMFTRFNTVMHPLYRGRSMSVSDVVVIDPEISADGVHDAFYSDQHSSASDNQRLGTDGTPSKEPVPIAKAGAYFCKAIGFTSITFDERQTHKPDNMLKVVYVEPNRKPFEAEILPDLKHLQQAVGGFIEPIYMDDGVIIVGNEEAKLQGMPGNRRLGKSILAGPLFICGEADEDFRSLTPEETEKYMDRFAEPEQISQQEVEADMGFTIISWY